jgi:hypothetical protein
MDASSVFDANDPTGPLRESGTVRGDEDRAAAAPTLVQEFQN